MTNYQDFGSGYTGNFTFPAGTTEAELWLAGGGGGGAGGGAGGAGAGGGSGVRGRFCLRGDLGGKTINIAIGVGGAAGAGSGGGGVAGCNGQHSVITLWNGFQLIAGAGEGGNPQGGTPLLGRNPQQGGRGGNVATVGTQPPGFTFSQFNLGSNHGQDAQPGWQQGAHGGYEGDCSGGGRGGPLAGNGNNGEGGYLELEWR